MSKSIIEEAMKFSDTTIPIESPTETEPRTVQLGSKPKAAVASPEATPPAKGVRFAQRAKYFASLPALIEMAGKHPLTPEQIAEAKDFQNVSDKFHSDQALYAADRVTQQFKAKKSCFVEKCKPGKPTITQTKRMALDVARQNMATSKAAELNWCRTVMVPAVIPMIQTLEDFVLDRAAQIRSQEEQTAELCGVPFEASETLQAVTALAGQIGEQVDQLKAGHGHISRFSPRQLLWGAI